MLKLMSVWAIAGMCVIAVSATFSAGASSRNPAELKPGDQAPDFALPGSDGKIHRLSDYKGKVVVLAWFPKAFTGG